MARYRRYAPAIRSTPEYRNLSGPGPNAQTLYDFLVIGPLTQIIPGLLVAGPASLFEALGWDDAEPETLGRVWRELLDSGLVRFDRQTRLIWLPDLSKDEYLPDQPNVLKSWSSPWAELPDCDLKHKAWTAIRETLTARQPRNRGKRDTEERSAATAFADEFLRSCPEPRCARKAHCEPNKHPEKQGNSQGESNSDMAGSHAGSHASSPAPFPALSDAPSRSGSLQDQDQDQEQKQKEKHPTRDPSVLTVEQVYRQLALLWTPAQHVLHVQWVACSPPPHPDLPGRMEPATERYWYDLMRSIQPSDEDLTKAAAYVAARQHWQDMRSKTGVTLAFLVKPNSGNLFDLLAKSKIWQPGSPQGPQAHRGHIAPSAGANQAVSMEELASLIPAGGNHGG